MTDRQAIKVNIEDYDHNITHRPDFNGPEYKPMFDAAKKAMEVEQSTGKMPGIRQPGAPSSDSPELNPKYAPDKTGTSPSGWNRVG